jgi:hypothetical protein
MSPRSPEEIVQDYYTSLQDACLVSRLNPAKLHFSDDIVLIGPNFRVEGKPFVIRSLEEQLIPRIEKLSIQRQFSDKNSVCTIFDCVTRGPQEKIPTVAWHKVKNGVIYEIQIFYDTAKWDKAA